MFLKGPTTCVRGRSHDEIASNVAYMLQYYSGTILRIILLLFERGKPKAELMAQFTLC